MENGKEWRWATGGDFVACFPRGAWTLLLHRRKVEAPPRMVHVHVMSLLADGGRAVVEA